MTMLSWGVVGERIYETGVDRGVLYLDNANGVAWNGLISVGQKSIGGEAQAYYIDGFKYLNRISNEEFGGTIEAYTYPDEFAECDGSVYTPYGFMVAQQSRKPFGLTYRTRVGNDVNASSHGYKIHLIYNALASPADRVYKSIGDNPEPITFAWDFTTTPVAIPGYKPTAHITIDTTKTTPRFIKLIEEFIYGSATSDPKLPTPQELITLFADLPDLLEIYPDAVTGLAELREGPNVDLTGDIDDGKFKASPTTRLVETSRPGFYTLEQ